MVKKNCIHANHFDYIDTIEPTERHKNTSLKTHDMNEGLEKYSFSCVESKKESAA